MTMPRIDERFIRMDAGQAGEPGEERDRRARDLLAAQAWPSATGEAMARWSRPEALARPRPRRAVGRWVLAAAGCLVVLVLAVLLRGEQDGALAKLAAGFGSVPGWLHANPTRPEGWLVCVEDGPDLRIMLTDVASGARFPLGGAYAGREPRHKDFLARMSPSGDAVAVADIDLDDGDVARYHFDLDLRELETWTPPARVIKAKDGRFPTAFVWSPDGRAILYQVEEAAPEVSPRGPGAGPAGPPDRPARSVGRPVGRTAAVELRLARLDRAPGDYYVLRPPGDDAVWRYDNEAADGVNRSELVAWDPSSRRAVLAVLGDPGMSEDVLRVVDLAGGRAVATTRVGRRGALEAPSPDGRSLAFVAEHGPRSGASSATVRLLDIRTGRVRDVAKAEPGDRVSGLVWSADAAWLAWWEHPGGVRGKADESYTVRAREVGAWGGGAVTTISKAGTEPRFMLFSPDSTYLLVFRGGDAPSAAALAYPLDGGAPAIAHGPAAPAWCVGWLPRGRAFEREIVAWPLDDETAGSWATFWFRSSSKMADAAQVRAADWLNVSEARARYQFEPPAPGAIDGRVYAALVDVWNRCPVCELRGPPKPPSEEWAVVIWRNPSSGEVMRSARLLSRGTPEPGEAQDEAVEWSRPERIGVAPARP